MTENHDSTELVSLINSVWREQKRREVLYLQALKKDKIGPLRRILTQGHFSAVLFQREIHALYDYFKCFLNDRELSAEDNLEFLGDDILNGADEQHQISGELRQTENRVILLYRRLYKYIDRESDARSMLDDHLKRISEFYDFFSRQEGVKAAEA